MSIEKYLNEIYKEPANESAELIMTGIATAGVVIDIISRAVSWYKEYKDNKQNKSKDEDAANFKLLKEKFLDTHSKVAIMMSVKNDIKKIVNEANTDKTVARVLKNSILKKISKKDSDISSTNFKIQYLDNGDHIRIISAPHEVISALQWFVLDAVKILKSKYADAISFGLLKIKTGDDDGCIYLE